MKRKVTLPLSKGEFRAITFMSLLICFSVILPPYLTGVFTSAPQTHVEIRELQPSKYDSENTSASSDMPVDGLSDMPNSVVTRPSHFKPLKIVHGKKRDSKTPVPGCKPFDPNSIAGDSLLLWGWSQYVVGNMLKYRSSGGTFRQPEDLQRVYGMDSTSYEQIRGCIKIAFEAALPIDVNKADTSQWMALPGIGPILSTRIVKFREKLGGFTTIDQVAETYGLSPETFEIIKPNLRMRSGPKTLNLHTATEIELAAHPYISRKQARVMINYFQQHGRPKSLDELSNLYIADSMWLQQITPYLIIGQADIN